MVAVSVLVASFLALHAQQSRWAAADDTTAKALIDMERRWAEAACDGNDIARTLLADDFQGTNTEGQRYDKAREIADTTSKPPTARDCRLLDARVRYFGDSLAVISGSESSVRTGKDGKQITKTQVWTDTWLKRDGKWQVIAAQDTNVE